MVCPRSIGVEYITRRTFDRGWKPLAATLNLPPDFKIRLEETNGVSGGGGVDGTPIAGTSGTTFLLSSNKVEGGPKVDVPEVDT